MRQKYKKLSEYAKERGIVYRTAWNRYKEGIIPGSFEDEKGRIYIDESKSEDKEKKRVITYSRVSSNDRKESLNEQNKKLEEFVVQKDDWVFVKSYKEVASGMNDNRTKLHQILDRNDWDALVIENKDRLTRFGFNFLEKLLNKEGKEIIVINSSDNEKEDLMKDLVSIIYSFSARMYGLRRRKKKDEIIDFLESQNNNQ